MLVSATGLTLAFVGGLAQAQAQADDWQPCASAAANGRIERVEIVLALDRSGSLKAEDVDPDGMLRRDAVRSTRERLESLQESVSQRLGRSGSGLDFGIDVALMAFNTTAETLAGFAPVGPDHPSDPDINAAVGAEGNTDYGPAVEEALARFDDPPNAAPDTTCRILVLFTDGILDPDDTAAGRRPELEDKATTHVSNLLADLCGTDPGLSGYRQRMENLGVSTYVAVLKGPAFDRGAGGSHLDFLARSSKQMILAVTGHGDSPLLGGVAAASGCESWSNVRAGKVIEIEDIGDLTDELANAVGEVGLAVRQPHIRCIRESAAEANFVGEWPHRLVVAHPTEESLCTVKPPLDGEVNLSVGGGGLPAGVEWLIDELIDDGVEPAASRRLSAGDADLSFNITSSWLPEDEPVNAAVGAAVEVLAVWYPEPLEAWPEQPDQVPLATQTLRLDVPDREAYYVDRHIECRQHQWSSWANATGGTQAEAAGLCDVKAPPAGVFEMALVAPEDNRLDWSASRAVGGGNPERVQRGEPILIKHDGGPIVLGGVSQVLAEDEVPLKGFEDDVSFRLTWRSPLGAVLMERTVAEVEIDVRSTTVDLLDCDSEAQPTAARESPPGEWALVVDTGCRLLRPPQGEVRATVAGDVRGRAWQLVDLPPAPEASWPTHDEVVLDPSQRDRTLFVGVAHPELDELVGGEVGLTLVATWSDGGSEALDEQRESRTAVVYLPVPRCTSRVDADRPKVEPPGSGDLEAVARARNLCEIDPPPNGLLEFRLLDEPRDPDLSWRLMRDGEPIDVLVVEPGDASVSVDVTSGQLGPALIGPFDTYLDFDLNWRSARGHSSGSGARVAVAVGPQPPELLDCSGEPAARGFGGEVPEGPLVVDTGCELLVHAAGVVELVGIEGAVAGVPWRLPEPVRLEPGDADRPILIESAGPLPNEPLAAASSFELVATLTLDNYESPADRLQRDVTVRLERRIRIRCAGTPRVVGAPIEVPEGPLVVDTGCTLLAPGVGTVTVGVDGDVAGVPWGFPGEVRLGPGDDDLPILIETSAPLPNRRYETVADFSLAATWHSPEGLEQSVGEQPSPGQASPEVAVALRARPSTGAAALIAVALLLAGLVLGWLVLWLVGRRANRLPRSGEYRFIRREVRAVVTPDGKVDLPGFDAASMLAGDSKPLVRRRARLRADRLTIRATVQWWNPRDLLGGGRAEAVLPNRRKLLVAASPSSGGPDCLSPSLAPGAVVVALDREPLVSRPDASEHRAQVWILIPSAAPRASTEQVATGNLRKARTELAKRLASRSAGGSPSRPTPGPASGAFPRQPGRPEPRPKG